MINSIIVFLYVLSLVKADFQLNIPNSQPIIQFDVDNNGNLYTLSQNKEFAAISQYSLSTSELLATNMRPFGQQFLGNYTSISYNSQNKQTLVFGQSYQGGVNCPIKPEQQFLCFFVESYDLIDNLPNLLVNYNLNITSIQPLTTFNSYGKASQTSKNIFIAIGFEVNQTTIKDGQKYQQSYYMLVIGAEQQVRLVALGQFSSTAPQVMQLKFDLDLNDNFYFISSGPEGSDGVYLNLLSVDPPIILPSTSIFYDVAFDPFTEKSQSFLMVSQDSIFQYYLQDKVLSSTPVAANYDKFGSFLSFALNQNNVFVVTDQQQVLYFDRSLNFLDNYFFGTSQTQGIKFGNAKFANLGSNSVLVLSSKSNLIIIEVKVTNNPGTISPTSTSEISIPSQIVIHTSLAVSDQIIITSTTQSSNQTTESIPLSTESVNQTSVISERSPITTTTNQLRGNPSINFLSPPPSTNPVTSTQENTQVAKQSNTQAIQTSGNQPSSPSMFENASQFMTEFVSQSGWVTIAAVGGVAVVLGAASIYIRRKRLRLQTKRFVREQEQI